MTAYIVDVLFFWHAGWDSDHDIIPRIPPHPSASCHRMRFIPSLRCKRPRLQPHYACYTRLRRKYLHFGEQNYVCDTRLRRDAIRFGQQRHVVPVRSTGILHNIPTPSVWFRTSSSCPPSSPFFRPSPHTYISSRQFHLPFSSASSFSCLSPFPSSNSILHTSSSFLHFFSPLHPRLPPQIHKQLLAASRCLRRRNAYIAPRSVALYLLNVTCTVSAVSSVSFLQFASRLSTLPSFFDHPFAFCALSGVYRVMCVRWYYLRVKDLS